MFVALSEGFVVLSIWGSGDQSVLTSRISCGVLVAWSYAGLLFSAFVCRELGIRQSPPVCWVRQSARTFIGAHVEARVWVDSIIDSVDLFCYPLSSRTIFHSLTFTEALNLFRTGHRYCCDHAADDKGDQPHKEEWDTVHNREADIAIWAWFAPACCSCDTGHNR